MTSCVSWVWPQAEDNKETECIRRDDLKNEVTSKPGFVDLNH